MENRLLLKHSSVKTSLRIFKLRQISKKILSCPCKDKIDSSNLQYLGVTFLTLTLTTSLSVKIRNINLFVLINFFCIKTHVSVILLTQKIDNESQFCVLELRQLSIIQEFSD